MASLHAALSRKRWIGKQRWDGVPCLFPAALRIHGAKVGDHSQSSLSIFQRKTSIVASRSSGWAARWRSRAASLSSSRPHDLLRAAGRNRRLQFREPSFQRRHFSIDSSSFRTRSSSSVVLMILANACTIFVSSRASVGVRSRRPTALTRAPIAATVSLTVFISASQRPPGVSLRGRQDAIQAETPGGHVAGQGAIDRLLSEGGHLTVKQGFQRQGRSVARSGGPSIWIAGLAFLPPAILRFFHGCHPLTSSPSCIFPVLTEDGSST